MKGMMDINNPMDLKDIKILYKYMQKTKFKDLSANALCILWVAFSETVPGTTCLQVRENMHELKLFADWLESGEEDPY